MLHLTRNDYEPDIVFFLASKASSFTDDQMQFQPPDFIVEVLSDSTESRDRGIKFNDDADHGVPEYRIVDCDGRSVEQYVIGPNRKYKLAQKMSQGNPTSVVVTDFTIPIAAIFDADALAEHFAAQG